MCQIINPPYCRPCVTKSLPPTAGHVPDNHSTLLQTMCQMYIWLHPTAGHMPELLYHSTLLAGHVPDVWDASCWSPSQGVPEPGGLVGEPHLQGSGEFSSTDISDDVFFKLSYLVVTVSFLRFLDFALIRSPILYASPTSMDYRREPLLPATFQCSHCDISVFTLWHFSVHSVTFQCSLCDISVFTLWHFSLWNFILWHFPRDILRFI